MNNFNEQVEVFNINDYLDTSSLSNKKYNKSSGIGKIITIILLLIIFLLLIIYGYNNALRSNKNGDPQKTVASEVVFDNTTKDITVSSVTFKVPTNIIAEVQDDHFTMQDKNFMYLIRVDVKEADFQIILNNYTSMKGNNNADYNGTPELKKYGDKDYITIETAKGLGKILMAFTDAKNGKTAVLSVINKKNSYDYNLLEKYAVIINSVS